MKDTIDNDDCPQVVEDDEEMEAKADLRRKYGDKQ